MESSPITPRMRFLDQVAGRPVARGLRWQERFWPETVQRWRCEGMAADHDFAWDFDDDGQSMGHLGIELGFLPAWEQGVVADEGETLLVRDQYGVIKRTRKAGSGMPQFVSFPVHDRASWEAVRARLAASNPARLPADWSARAASSHHSPYPVSFGGTHLCGFFSFLRELCGDDVYYLMHDDPGLIADMVAFQGARLEALLRQAASAARIDRLFIWEDMCYKNGPLIGPRDFRRFLLPAYQSYIACARACGIPVVDVDSDGDVTALLPLWVEAGVDLLHPFEVAAGMDVVAVSRAWGGRLAMRGGVDKRALAAGEEAIAKEIERIRPAYEAGRYFPAVDHSVPPDVSWDSFRRYLDARDHLVGAR